MPYFIYCNGAEVHDEGEHDKDLKVTRAGGSPLSFTKKSDAEKAADALFARDLARHKARAIRRGRVAPVRASYVVATEPPAVPDPEAPADAETDPRS